MNIMSWLSSPFRTQTASEHVELQEVQDQQNQSSVRVIAQDHLPTDAAPVADSAPLVRNASAIPPSSSAAINNVANRVLNNHNNVENSSEVSEANSQVLSNFSNEENGDEIRATEAEEVNSNLEAPKDLKKIDAAIIQQLQNDMDQNNDNKVPLQKYLVEILTNLQKYDIDSNSLEVNFALVGLNNQPKLETFVLDNKLYYSASGTHTIKFTSGGQEYELKLTRTIYTKAADPQLALAAAQYFGEGCKNIVNQKMGLGQDTIEFNDESIKDLKNEKGYLLEAKSFNITFKRNLQGNFIGIESLSNHSLKLNFKNNFLNPTTDRLVNDSSDSDAQIDQIFRTKYRLRNSKVSAEFIQAIQEKIQTMTDKNTEIEKHFETKHKSRNFLKKQRITINFNQDFITNLNNFNLIENKISPSTIDSPLFENYTNIKLENEKNKENREKWNAILQKLENEASLTTEEEALIEKLLEDNNVTITQPDEAQAQKIKALKLYILRQTQQLEESENNLNKFTQETYDQYTSYMKEYEDYQNSTFEIQNYLKLIQTAIKKNNFEQSIAIKELENEAARLTKILKNNQKFLQRLEDKFLDMSQNIAVANSLSELS